MPSLASRSAPAAHGARPHDALQRYRAKRDFEQTPEPQGRTDPDAAPAGRRYIIQKHAARQLHYDFRLELDGTLKSWAVPKGPSLDPQVKRMAVQVEDHPLAYADFEGDIPPGHYGAGHVELWDSGSWTPRGDARAGYRAGKLEFELHGRRLRGRWALVRMRPRSGERQPAWLLIKQPDAPAPQAAAPVPEQLSPELATLVDRLPASGDWLYEIKYDGYRLLTRADGDRVVCRTRNGHDWSDRLPHIVRAVRALGLVGSWLDGELVVFDPRGVPDFQALQNAFDAASTSRIVYCLFDLPFLAGEDLREQPVEQRRERLRRLLVAATADDPATPLRFSASYAEDPALMLESARGVGLEGLIAKRKGSPYVSRRSTDWIKLKALSRQEFVVVGWTDPKGARIGLGSLLLAVHEPSGRLRYVGNVGAGFGDASLRALQPKLAALATDTPPVADPPRRVGVGTPQVPHWVRPELLAEVSYAEWTQGRLLRQPVFHGLREDKAAAAITQEPVAKVPRVADIRVTHPERVIDPASGTTKGALVAYYAEVAPLMLPHLKQRPLALLRAPAGIGGGSFFQKHADRNAFRGVTQLDPALDPGHPPLLAVTQAVGLAALAQMNVVELHTWNATARAIDRPDRVVFDLDPGEGVAWPQVREAAQLLQALLRELKLDALLKTSGGKGLHVIVPLVPQHGWDAVKGWAQAVVEHLARVLPERFVARSGAQNRVGRIYIDYLRNGFGATTVCAWSARARPGLGVSVPLGWDELPQLRSAAQWTVPTIGERLAIGNAPWAGIKRQRLGPAMKALGHVAPAPR